MFLYNRWLPMFILAIRLILTLHAVQEWTTSSMLELQNHPEYSLLCFMQPS